MSAAPTRVRSVRGVPPVVGLAIVAAWLLAIAAEATGAGRLLHHDALVHAGLSAGATIVLFLLAWQVMIAAMMLPSSLPLVGLFGVTSAGQERPRAAMAAFVGGYALVWTVFGAAAFAGDVALHTFVESTPWLAARPWLVAGSVLALAGAFQFSSLKDQCLRSCRHPGAYLLRHYRRGLGEAFRLGRGHGLYCLGCCWALMLVMFAAGVAELWWMAALTALMVYEKTQPGGRRVGAVAGAVLLAWAAVVFAQPGWLPAALGGSGPA